MTLDIKTIHWTVNTILFLLFLCKLCSGCGRAEYSLNGECCPMCSAGNRVYRHCTDYSSTSCIPCVDETFTDQPNGLDKCRPCSICDAGLGVETLRRCTSSSDAVCTCMKGHYCEEPNKDGCKLCQKHSTCNPGQFIKQKGSYSTDTLCEGCPTNTFSDGFFNSCQRHTDCELLGRKTRRRGSPSSDAECEEKPDHTALITGTSVPLVVLLVIAGIVAFLYKKKMLPCMKSEMKNTQETPTCVALMSTESHSGDGTCTSPPPNTAHHQRRHEVVHPLTAT
ncbi:tumor necrosis factor receptor superfamily member 14 isoform X2 [Amia ocellicauda]|uniref:tumor necrosis factor receptor superfamily member 14 isoform X2 n=1 Tax=Amia ocellicauda TaxID=2972642 RepID=UPI00346418D2